MKKILLLSLLLVGGCSTPKTTINPSGEYSTSDFYRLQGGVLYAWDGKEWYSLKTPQFEAGAVGGIPVSQVECWIKAGGDRNQCYMRTLATYQDKNLCPVFMPY